MTTIERFLSDGKDECTPAIRNHAANGCPKRVRMSALEFGLAETLGGHGEAGMESEEGTAFESLPRRKLCRNTVDQPFLFLNPQFTARWSLRCQLP
ncbi:MAG: hypothetical protein WB660_19355 [Candidatus Sulfotelmatobacter sp.]